jgi:hypothetical protein
MMRQWGEVGRHGVWGGLLEAEEVENETHNI